MIISCSGGKVYLSLLTIVDLKYGLVGDRDVIHKARFVYSLQEVLVY